MTTRKHLDHSQPEDPVILSLVALLGAGLVAVHLAGRRLPAPVARAAGATARVAVRLPGQAVAVVRHQAQGRATRL